MTGMMLYLALGFMVLTVLSNRYWRNHLDTTRVSAKKAREAVEEITKEVAEVSREYAKLSTEFARAEQRAAKAEQELEQALHDLERIKEAPVERYYVFDRLEPRAGRFWEAAVRHAAAAADERLPHRTWVGIRRYLLIADSERDARERLAARFPRKGGFEVVEVAPCRLANLTVNRISELSTFRKPGTGVVEDAGKANRRVSSGRS